MCQIGDLKVILVYINRSCFTHRGDVDGGGDELWRDGEAADEEDEVLLQQPLLLSAQTDHRREEDSEHLQCNGDMLKSMC